MTDFRTLIDGAAIESRIRELASEVARAYPDQPPCVVAVMEGARIFGSHLMRHLAWPTVVHEIRASSYGTGTTSNGDPQVSGAAIPVQGRQVLVIEDIVDTGHTIARLQQVFTEQGATEVDVITLLSKPSRREADVPLRYVGFEIPNEFVIGFGMDVAGRYRELDHVAIYDAAREARA